MTFWRLLLQLDPTGPLKKRIAATTSRTPVRDIDRAGLREALSGDRDEEPTLDDILSQSADEDDFDIDSI